MSNLFDKTYTKNDRFPWQTLAKETIIIDPQDKNSFELNQMSSFIWQAMNGSTSLSQIKKAICAEFEVSEDEAGKDLLEVTSNMLDHALLTEQT